MTNLLDSTRGIAGGDPQPNVGRQRFHRPTNSLRIIGKLPLPEMHRGHTVAWTQLFDRHGSTTESYASVARGAREALIAVGRANYHERRAFAATRHADRVFGPQRPSRNERLNVLSLDHFSGRAGTVELELRTSHRH
ncbi:MAG TPA: hypothetical protein VEN29_13365 [Casimicrobiaceae bacterium]|nr:hypothetical protein [Casimicrobiaceae bacterium]